MRAHRTDGVSLVFGTVFLMIALWWGISEVVTVKLPMVGWTAAGVLILFGLVGLLGAIRPRRAEVKEPVHAVVETPGDLPPQMHAAIVQELLDDPATRFNRQHPPAATPAPTFNPAQAWPSAPTSAPPATPAAPPTSPTLPFPAVPDSTATLDLSKDSPPAPATPPAPESRPAGESGTEGENGQPRRD